MKSAILFLCFFLPALQGKAVTDPKVADFLGRLNKYYYSLNREGLRSFQADATGTIYRSDPSEGTTPFNFDFSYLGNGLSPVLSSKKAVGATPAGSIPSKKTEELVNSLVRMWGAIYAGTLFNPEVSGVTDRVTQTPGGGFSVQETSPVENVTFYFDSQAICRRMVAAVGNRTIEIDLGFAQTPKGLILDRVEVGGISTPGGIVNFQMKVRYQEIQGFQLPVSFELTGDCSKRPLTVNLQLSNYRVFDTAGVGAAPPVNDTQILPSESEAPGAKHFLWRVRSSTATVYLLGSVHTRSETPLLLPETVERCYESSNYVGFETDFSDKEKDDREMKEYLKTHFRYPPGDDLKNHATPEEWAVIQSLLEHYGLDPQIAAKMKPILLGFVLASLAGQKQGLDPNMGIDEIFMRKAKSDHKPVFGMEFWYEPFEAMNRLDDRMQIHALVSDVHEAGDGDSHMDQILDFWAKGDDQGMSALHDANVRPEEKDFDEIILKDRNNRWMRQFDRMLASHSTYFVVVGSLHLVGQYGLPNWLKFKGYSVDHL